MFFQSLETLLTASANRRLARCVAGGWGTSAVAWLRVCACLVLSLWGAEVRCADNVPPARSEYEIKAAFLFKFALFSEWPTAAFAASNTPVKIGILGRDPFGERLELVLRDKTIRQHPLEFVRFTRVEEALAAKCHLLFIGRSEQVRLREILNALGSSPILTVGDTAGYADSGVMINLLLLEQTVRFEINEKAVTGSGLRVSSQLLDLAVTVKSRISPDGP